LDKQTYLRKINMSEKLRSPIGRLVMGSLYTPDTEDFYGKPLTDKTGKPTVKYWIKVAVAKGTETHWNQTAWGQIIWGEAVKAFPDGRFNNRQFAWKVTDGDSTEVNQKGTRPCDNEGYPGHWILSFSTQFAPTLCNIDGSIFTMPEGAIKTGYFIQVYGSIEPNVAQMNPGMFLNFSHVAFIGYGAEIMRSNIDPKTIGFGGAMPVGCSPVPVGMSSQPAPASAPVTPAAPPVTAAPAPYNAILTPKQMTDKANGLTYEAYKQAGWTDEQLIQNGMMLA
jgi:hypothetical protein